MKMYFKNIAGQVYTMLDSDTFQVIDVYYTSQLSSANNVIRESFYNTRLTETQDSSRWQVSNETDFNAVKANVINSI